MYILAGKTAVVCGSTQGIGKAIALELASQGANLILIARNEQKLKDTLAELPTCADQMHAYLVADFSYAEQLQQNLHRFIRDEQEIHILINNTGGPTAGPAYFANVAEYVAAFNQHLVCNQILVQKVVPLMKSAGYGRIINILSTSVKQPIEGLGVSNTIRAAVANWAKTLSVELGPYGITVNNVLPGYTETRRLQALIENKSRLLSESEESIIQNMKSGIPLKRFAQPQEIAKVVAFLAGPDASYINGVNLPVDGGKTNVP